MRRLTLLVLLCFPTFFFFIDKAAITDSDEAFYAESAREMVESGDWITPHFNYNVRFEKPILFYWMIGASYALAGVGEGSARFWAAMSGVGVVVVAYLVGRRWFDDETGFAAGAVTATSFATAAMARQALPDLPLAFFITLAVWAGYEACSTAERPASVWSRRQWFSLSAAACALAVLTKGPIGVALPVLIVVPAVSYELWRDPSHRRALRVRFSDVAVAGCVFLAIAVPWYAAVTWVHGTGYLYRFFVGENLVRFATDRFNEPRPLWFYLPILLGGLLPWTPFAILWMRKSTAGVTFVARKGELVRLGCWALVPLLIFSISIGKQPRYILPCLVPLAVILGAAISTRVRATLGGHRDILLTVAGSLSALIVLTAGVLLYRIGPLVALVNGRPTQVWALAVMLAAAVVLVAATWRSARALPMAVASAASLTLVAMQATLIAAGRPDAVISVADVIARTATPQDTVCACGAFLRNLPFYTQRQVLQAGTQDEVNNALSMDRPVVAAIDTRKLLEAEAALNRRFERLVEAPYLNTALLRLDDFIVPYPERAIQRIVVIRTK